MLNLEAITQDTGSKFSFKNTDKDNQIIIKLGDNKHRTGAKDMNGETQFKIND